MLKRGKSAEAQCLCRYVLFDYLYVILFNCNDYVMLAAVECGDHVAVDSLAVNYYGYCYVLVLNVCVIDGDVIRCAAEATLHCTLCKGKVRINHESLVGCADTHHIAFHCVCVPSNRACDPAVFHLECAVLVLGTEVAVSKHKG